MSSANSSASLAAVSEVRIRQELPDLVLDGLLLDREESGKTILEAWEGKGCTVPDDFDVDANSPPS